VNVTGEATAPDFGFIFPFAERWTLTQTGSQLIRSVDGGPPVTGSIDPATGAFSFDLGTVYIVPYDPSLGSCGHAFVAATAAADSQTFTGSESGWFFKATPPLVGCHATISMFAGTRTCGNGVLDFGEQCDDGNWIDGDCCSSACQIDPDGAACGAPCRVGASCTAGACTGGTPALAGTTCDDHDPARLSIPAMARGLRGSVAGRLRALRDLRPRIGRLPLGTETGMRRGETSRR